MTQSTSGEATGEYRYQTTYGKARVPVFRVGWTPLTGVTPVPESPFTGRQQTLVMLDVDVEVLEGDQLAAYTEGDNRQVVATDSMKNLVLRESLHYQGATVEGLLGKLGEIMLATYGHLQRLRVSATERPVRAMTVPDGDTFGSSDRLFSVGSGEQTTASLELVRDGNGGRIVDQRSGRVGMHLLKTTGSAFTHFVRDDYTTLPERGDRPLFIGLDVFWRYQDASVALGEDPARYVATEQLRDLVGTVFHEFVSESIQHLVHEMGKRALTRWPQLSEVAFAGRNLTPDPVDRDGDSVVYTAPFPAYGLIELTMSRSEVRP